MSIYTRTGDDGTTGLHGGERVSKGHARVVACGDIDELNAVLGWSLQNCSGEKGMIRDCLDTLQAELFEVGADLATPTDSPYRTKVSPVGTDEIARIERWIDSATARLPEQRSFVLPGGTELASRLHMARTVCRRAERSLVLLFECEARGAVRSEILAYLNRVSDLLFVLARLANAESGVPDVPWMPKSAGKV